MNEQMKARTGWRMAMVAALSVLASGTAKAVPFVETFNADNAGWTNNANAATGWVGSGGPDGSGYITSEASVAGVNPDGSVVFHRAGATSSGGQFIGNWIDLGIDELSFYIRHNAPVPLTAFVRVAHSQFNFPGAVAVQFVPVLPGVWTEVTVAVVAGNPQFVTFEDSDFATVFGSAGRMQIGVDIPEGLAGTQTTVRVDVDSVSAVPGPASAAVLLPLLVAYRARRGGRKATA